MRLKILGMILYGVFIAAILTGCMADKGSLNIITEHNKIEKYETTKKDIEKMFGSPNWTNSDSKREYWIYKARKTEGSKIIYAEMMIEFTRDLVTGKHYEESEGVNVFNYLNKDANETSSSK